MTQLGVVIQWFFFFCFSKKGCFFETFFCTAVQSVVVLTNHTVEVCGSDLSTWPVERVFRAAGKDLSYRGGLLYSVFVLFPLCCMHVQRNTIRDIQFNVWRVITCAFPLQIDALPPWIYVRVIYLSHFFALIRSHLVWLCPQVTCSGVYVLDASLFRPNAFMSYLYFTK